MLKFEKAIEKFFNFIYNIMNVMIKNFKDFINEESKWEEGKGYAQKGPFFLPLVHGYYYSSNNKEADKHKRDSLLELKEEFETKFSNEFYEDVILLTKNWKGWLYYE